MANKTQTQDDNSLPNAEAFNAFAHLQEAGLGNMMGMSTAWMEAISDMGAEVARFVADRIKEDVKTQHEILHCKTVTDLQHIQGQFIQKAMEQYIWSEPGIEPTTFQLRVQYATDKANRLH